ncbi:WD40 repeat-like protein [Decorospora gaudefroyi]|uniref:WD40 repeat-like protein n=1 Tax=Decorospora gaudefroyi TaxID=184978 RepID=A0A6A5K854_9PLEO|nr:WD40 repeat-like protein [Decorospora gaudefroyi]
MLNSKSFCAFTILFHSVHSKSFSRQNDPESEFLLPHLTSDFNNGNTSAQLAQGYPQKWGSEELRFQFNDPQVQDVFSAVVTEDEKYLAMLNGSHVRFVDLDTKDVVSTIDMGAPSDTRLPDLVLRATRQGGYDLLSNAGDIFQRRLGPDLKPIGEVVTYPDDRIGAFDNTGRVATTEGYIYDLNNPKTTRVTLDITHTTPSFIRAMSFSDDGQYLSTVGSSADLWNATSGEKIFEFPAERPETRLTTFSPDSKYVAVAASLSHIQLYSLSELSAEPTMLGPFRGLISDIAWSPDSKYLAAGDFSRVQLWKFPEVGLVQTWTTDSSSYTSSSLSWLDGSSKLAFSYRYSWYIYDFETNVKYWITQGVDDHTWDYYGSISYLKKRGFFATVDGDSYVRFWKV